jgi:hypothetical protein
MRTEHPTYRRRFESCDLSPDSWLTIGGPPTRLLFRIVRIGGYYRAFVKQRANKTDYQKDSTANHYPMRQFHCIAPERFLTWQNSKQTVNRTCHVVQNFARTFCLTVPELTRNAGIQLNERVSLRCAAGILSSLAVA